MTAHELEAIPYEEEETTNGGIVRLIETAITKDLAIEKLEKLLNLREQYERREAEKAFHRAKAAFQRQCPEIPHDCKVTTPNAEWTYASLGQICRIVSPCSGKNGLSWHWEDAGEGDARRKVCVLTHERGHEERSDFTLSKEGQQGGLAKMTLQQQEGAADTYAKSRTLQNVLGIGTAMQDTDGMTAIGHEIEDWEVSAIKKVWWLHMTRTGQVDQTTSKEVLAERWNKFAPQLKQRNHLKVLWLRLLETMTKTTTQQGEHDADETDTADRPYRPEESRGD